MELYNQLSEAYENFDAQITESKITHLDENCSEAEFLKSFDGGVIYIIKIINQDLYKIGVSGSENGMRNRIQQIRTSSPFDTQLLFYVILEAGLSENAYALEKFLHKQLKKYHVKREWFNLPIQCLLQLTEFMDFDLMVWDSYHSDEYLETISEIEDSEIIE